MSHCPKIKNWLHVPVLPFIISHRQDLCQAERKWSNPSPSWHQWHHQCPWMPHSLVLSAPTLRGKAVSPWGKLYRKPIRSNQTSNGFFMSYPHVQLDRPTSTWSSKKYVWKRRFQGLIPKSVDFMPLRVSCPGLRVLEKQRVNHRPNTGRITISHPNPHMSWFLYIPTNGWICMDLLDFVGLFARNSTGNLTKPCCWPFIPSCGLTASAPTISRAMFSIILISLTAASAYGAARFDHLKWTAIFCRRPSYALYIIYIYTILCNSNILRDMY